MFDLYDAQFTNGPLTHTDTVLVYGDGHERAYGIAYDVADQVGTIDPLDSDTAMTMDDPATAAYKSAIRDAYRDRNEGQAVNIRPVDLVLRTDPGEPADCGVPQQIAADEAGNTVDAVFMQIPEDEQEDLEDLYNADTYPAVEHVLTRTPR